MIPHATPPLPGEHTERLLGGDTLHHKRCLTCRKGVLVLVQAGVIQWIGPESVAGCRCSKKLQRLMFGIWKRKRT